MKGTTVSSVRVVEKVKGGGFGKPSLPFGRLVLFLVALVGSLAASGGADRQEQVVLWGRVLDAETEAPVHGAFVGLASTDRGVVTDSLGQFRLEVGASRSGEEPLASYRLRVFQLGYQDFVMEIDPSSWNRPITVLLPPAPVEVAGLTVLGERLAERRRGIYGVGDFLDRAELLEAPEGSGFDLILRMLPFAQPCTIGSEALCLTGRARGISGGDRQVSVCVDNQRIPPGMIETALSGVDPRGLYLVEVYGRVGEVRMYTPGYIRRMARLGRELPPLSFGCG